MRTRFAIVAVLTLLCVGWVIRKIDLSTSWEELQTLEPIWFAALMFLCLLNLVARTLRFALLLEQRVPLRSLFSIVTISMLAINTAPLRLGELVRPYLLAEKCAVPVGQSMAAVLIERLIDMVAVLFMIGCVSWFVDLPAAMKVGDIDLLVAAQRAIGTALVVGVLGLGGLTIAGHALVDRIHTALSPFSARWAARLSTLLRSFVDSARFFVRHPLRGLGILALTVAFWVAAALPSIVLLEGFDSLEVAWDVGLVTFVGSLTGMVLIPTPGFIGSFEAGTIAAATLMGIPEDLATTYAIVWHLSLLLFFIVTGVIALFIEGWSFSRIMQESLEETGKKSTDR